MGRGGGDSFVMCDAVGDGGQEVLSSVVCCCMAS